MESDLVTDLDFSPSIANLLATTSKNGTVKLWKIPEDGLTQSTNKPKSTFKSKNSCDLVKFHHLSPNLLTTASREWINFYDLSSENQVFGNEMFLKSIKLTLDGVKKTYSAFKIRRE